MDVAASRTILLYCFPISSLKTERLYMATCEGRGSLEIGLLLDGLQATTVRCCFGVPFVCGWRAETLISADETACLTPRARPIRWLDGLGGL